MMMMMIMIIIIIIIIIRSLGNVYLLLWAALLFFRISLILIGRSACKNLNFGGIFRLCPNTVTWPKYPKIIAVTVYKGTETTEFPLDLYTGCHRRNRPNFGRVFLMLNYTDITQNTYVPS